MLRRPIREWLERQKTQTNLLYISVINKQDICRRQIQVAWSSLPGTPEDLRARLHKI